MNVLTLRRFTRKFKMLPNGCWEWTASLDTGGYGKFYHNGWLEGAHRVSYKHFIGRIKTGLTLDHKCRFRACVNPNHLTPMTLQKNISLGFGMTAKNSQKKFCPQGHSYFGKNLLKCKGGRRCRICRKEQHKKYKRNLQNRIQLAA